MPVLDRTNKDEVEKYNKFVRSREHASALQDLNWGKVKEGEWECEAVYLEQNGNITAAMTILIRTFAKGITLMYAPRGPVCDIEDISTVKITTADKTYKYTYTGISKEDAMRIRKIK